MLPRLLRNPGDAEDVLLRGRASPPGAVPKPPPASPAPAVPPASVPPPPASPDGLAARLDTVEKQVSQMDARVAGIQQKMRAPSPGVASIGIEERIEELRRSLGEEVAAQVQAQVKEAGAARDSLQNQMGALRDRLGSLEAALGKLQRTTAPPVAEESQRSRREVEEMRQGQQRLREMVEEIQREIPALGALPAEVERLQSALGQMEARRRDTHPPEAQVAAALARAEPPLVRRPEFARLQSEQQILRRCVEDLRQEMASLDAVPPTLEALHRALEKFESQGQPSARELEKIVSAVEVRLGERVLALEARMEAASRLLEKAGEPSPPAEPAPWLPPRPPPRAAPRLAQPSGPRWDERAKSLLSEVNRMVESPPMADPSPQVIPVEVLPTAREETPPPPRRRRSTPRTEGAPGPEPSSPPPSPAPRNRGKLIQEREDVETFLRSVEEYHRQGAVSADTYRELKAKNEERLRTIERELSGV
ncbi:MAG: hypothetical protein HY558_06995 [Euryarchaeota archaeon]|nr:hypothetical protein [Euryarchaeota archaeon]